jgi:hypothetical protein
MSRITLNDWIADALADKDKDSACTQITLVHMHGSVEKELHTIRLNGSKQYSAAEIGDLMTRKSRGFAQDLEGVQTFQILAFYGKSEPEARHPFLVNSDPEAFRSGLSTEGPSERGRVQQGMRHLEMNLQLVYQQQRSLNEFSIRMMAEVGKQALDARHEAAEAWGMAKELLLERDSKQHERDMEALQFTRATAERKKWMQILPPLVNSILGREVFPQSTEDTAIIEAIAENIKEEDVHKLLSLNILPQEALGPLFARFERYADKKNKENREIKDETERQLAARSKNPLLPQAAENDAVGGTDEKDD